MNVGEEMSEASALDQVAPAGWFQDPAKPDMQRWWTGTEWTDHVRYSDAPRLYAVTATPEPAPIVETPPARDFAPIDDPRLNDFYVPMRNSFAGARGSAVIKPRRSFAAGAVWLLLIAAVGVSAGIALWVLLPR